MKPRIHKEPKQLNIKCSKRELEAWRKMSKGYELKLSEWVRGVLNGKSKP